MALEVLPVLAEDNNGDNAWILCILRQSLYQWIFRASGN
jgi:hypothetical protein